MDVRLPTTLALGDTEKMREGWSIDVHTVGSDA